MTDLTERLIALRQEGGDAAAMRLLDEAVNRLTELEAECEHLRAKGLAEHGGRYEEFERAERLREALEASAEALHDLNDDHLGHTFTDCPNWRCVAARAALRPGVSEGVVGPRSGQPGLTPASAGPLADSERPDASKRTINEPTFPHERCPTCGSDDPTQHPLRDRHGEGHLYATRCPDPFHGGEKRVPLSDTEEGSDDLPQWLSVEASNYRGGGVMGRRRQKDTKEGSDG